MHHSHIENIRRILPNLSHAVFNKSVTSIGGGDFTSDEINSVYIALQCIIANDERASKVNETNARKANHEIPQALAS